MCRESQTFPTMHVHSWWMESGLTTCFIFQPAAAENKEDSTWFCFLQLSICSSRCLASFKSEENVWFTKKTNSGDRESRKKHKTYQSLICWESGFSAPKVFDGSEAVLKQLSRLRLCPSHQLRPVSFTCARFSVFICKMWGNQTALLVLGVFVSLMCLLILFPVMMMKQNKSTHLCCLLSFLKTCAQLHAHTFTLMLT